MAAESREEALAKAIERNRHLIRQVNAADDEALGAMLGDVFQAGVRWGYNAGYDDGYDYADGHGSEVDNRPDYA